ncbi:putative holin-like toxin [Lysinibacillus xylanilyticus]|uniref:putative holin-like toxin n=1 Tax=Lysinibacillus xylanilyticus TaxID=582475 RepID=UPI002B25059D|nr:putative holin-like toxin [Lysinibacillus xylanilyticus]MEB2301179.1 putative holin-like toxin [Lysinibacillus xylanilyticus]
MTIFEAIMVAISFSSLIVAVIALSFTFTQKKQTALASQACESVYLIILQIVFEAIRLDYEDHLVLQH